MNAVPFADFTAQVLSLYAPPIRRPRTVEKLDQALREFAPFCPTTADITPTAVAGWIAAHAGSRSPIASFSLLRAFASATRAGITLGLIDSAADPFRFRPPARWWPDGDLEPPERTRHLSAVQARALLDRAERELIDAAAPDRWEAMRLATLVRLVLSTGLRRSEALGLRVEDVDLAGGMLVVRPNGRRHLKPGASRRRVPIPHPLRLALEAWLAAVDSEWLFPGVTRVGPWLSGPRGQKALDRVRQLGERAELPGVTILALRHTYATLAESLGFGELLLQRLLGHRRRRTQLHYRHEEIEALRRAGDRFEL